MRNRTSTPETRSPFAALRDQQGKGVLLGHGSTPDDTALRADYSRYVRASAS